AGSNGPHRFVGDHDFGELLLAQAGDSFLELTNQYGFGLATFPLFQAFAHTDDRRQSERQCGLCPLENGFIGLAEVLTAFAMPHDRVGSAGGGDHGTGDLTGEGAILGPGDILRPHLDAGAFGGLHGRRKVREGRTDHDLAVFGTRDQRPELLEECNGFGGRLEHLPIARHDWFSHTIWSKKLTPWEIAAPKLAATV